MHLVFVVGNPDAYVSPRRCVLKRITEQVDDDLVEVATVYPYRQHLGVMLIDKTDVLGLGLLVEESVNITNKRDKLRLTHVHLHLPFVYLTKVHHLVDES